MWTDHMVSLAFTGSSVDRLGRKPGLHHLCQQEGRSALDGGREGESPERPTALEGLGLMPQLLRKLTFKLEKKNPTLCTREGMSIFS